MYFHPAERVILLVIGALAAVDLILVWQKSITVGVDYFFLPMLLVGLFLGVGQALRRSGLGDRIELTLNMLGLFILFSFVGAMFNVVLLPREGTPIDPLLVRIDAALGYSWPEICAWIAGYPLLNEIIRAVYSVTLLQVFLAFLLLGLRNDRRRLHAACLAMIMCSLTVIIFWAAVPSGGASAYWTLAPEVDAIVRPVVDSRHGAEIYRLLREGVSDLSAIGIKGLIGFPSFHTCMGLVSLLAVWPYRAFRFALILFGLVLLPGILIHGGHNLVDVIAGAAVSFAAWGIGLRVHDRLERKAAPRAVTRPSPA